MFNPWGANRISVQRRRQPEGGEGGAGGGGGTGGAGGSGDGGQGGAGETAEQKAAREATEAEAAKVKKIGEDAVAEFKKTLPVVPEKYDLKIEGEASINAAAIEKAGALARDLGLSNEAATKLANHLNTTVAERQAALLAEEAPGGEKWKARVSGWEKDALAHKEIGNGNPETLKTRGRLAGLVIEKFFPKSIVEFAKATGFGSNPDFIVGFARIADAMGEASLVPAQDSGGKSTKSTAEIMYPDHAKKG